MSKPFLALISPVGGDRPDRPAGPVDPGFGIPLPPTVWPPPPGRPERPHVPVDPGYGVPEGGAHPSHPIVLPPPGSVPPGTVWPPLPPDVVPPEGALIVVWIPGVGYKWIRVEAPPAVPAEPAPAPV